MTFAEIGRAIVSYLFQRSLVAVMFVIAVAGESPAAIIWQESINSDLSNNQSAPTVVVLGVGKNTIIGSLETGTDVNDWLTVSVPTGFQLNGLVNSFYDSEDDQGHMGFQVGSVFVGNFGWDPSVYAGYTHFGHHAQNGSFPVFNSVDFNLFPIMQSQAAGSQGFTTPLPAGDYAFIFQQTGELTNYQFDFNVAPVPEPSTLLLAFVGSAVGWSRLRSRRTRPTI